MEGMAGALSIRGSIARPGFFYFAFNFALNHASVFSHISGV